MIEAKPTENHRRGMQTESQQKNQIIDVIVPTKAFAPQENRVNHAQAVGNHGQEEKMSISEPSHGRAAYASLNRTQGELVEADSKRLRP